MIDQSTQAELMARFNPDGSLLRSHQLRMLEMLKYIDKVCRENNIQYWLSSGTCLGAIRHGGFIPWDDDVDIEMLRDDYLKLEKILLTKNDYYLQTYNTDPYYVAPYSKLRDKKSVISEYSQDLKYRYKGVYIDIFQLEASPQWLSHLTERINWRILLLGSRSNKFTIPFFFLLKNLFYMSVPVLRCLCRLFCDANILRHTFGSGFYKRIRRREWLIPTCLADFEGCKFPIPKDVNSYLRSLYGSSYMNLPDLEKIHGHVTRVEIY